MSSHRDIKWFPLDRIEDLERAISALIACKRTARDGIGCALGLHGLRAREVTHTLAKHFQPLNRSLYVCPFDPASGTCKPLKHGIPRTIKLHQSVVDAIMLHRSQAKGRASKWLLPNRSGDAVKTQLLSSKGRDLLLGLGMMDDPSTRFHMFRHTFAMRLLAQTNDIMLVKKQLGHANVQTTMAYLDCIKEVPPECLVRLYAQPSPAVQFEHQLSLFDPLDEATEPPAKAV